MSSQASYRFRRFFEAARTVAAALDTQDRRLEMFHKIKRRLGNYEGACFTYSDEHIGIVAATDGSALSVEKVDSRDPVVYSDERGDFFRVYAEMWQLEAHLLRLTSPLELLARQASDTE